MYAQDARNSFAGSAIGGGIGALAAAETAQRLPEVVAELNRLEKSVDMLTCTADTLSSRLLPVRNRAGNGVKGEQAPEPVLCDVASMLRARRQRVEEVQAVLQCALNELEI